MYQTLSTVLGHKKSLASFLTLGRHPPQPSHSMKSAVTVTLTVCRKGAGKTCYILPLR